MTPEQRQAWLTANPRHYVAAHWVAQDATASWRRLGFPPTLAHAAALAAVDLYIVTVDYAKGPKK